MTTTDERIRSNKPAGNDIRTSRAMKDRAVEENREITDDECSVNNFLTRHYLICLVLTAGILAGSLRQIQEILSTRVCV